MLVDTAANAGHDPLNDLQQMLFVGKNRVRLLQSAQTLDIHFMRTIDENIADIRVLQIWLEWPQAKRLGDQFLDQPLFIDGGNFSRMGAEHAFGEAADVVPQLLIREARD